MKNTIKHITLQNTIHLLLELIRKLLYGLVLLIEFLVNQAEKLVQYFKKLAAPRLAIFQQMIEKRAVEFLEH
jgi:hypothetical protein